MQSRKQHSYIIPLIISILLHSILLVLLLCALYTHEISQQKEHLPEQMPSRPVFFYPLPQGTPQPTPATLPTAPQGSTAGAQKPPSTSIDTDDAHADEVPPAPITSPTSTIASTPSEVSDTAPEEALTPSPPAPTRLAHAQKAEQQSTPVTHKTDTAQTARTHAHKKISTAATQQLAKLSTGFFNNVQQATDQQAAEYEGTHTAQRQLNTTIEQRYYAKIWQALKMAFDVHKKGIYLKDNVDTYATLHITLMRNGQLVEVGLHHARKTAEVATIESVLRGAAQAVGMFPPVPRVFHEDPLIIKLPLAIKTHAGFHTYDLIYNTPA